jgi:hypothetical protein
MSIENHAIGARYLERLRARPAFQASLPEGSTRPIAWLPDAASLP